MLVDSLDKVISQIYKIMSQEYSAINSKSDAISSRCLPEITSLSVNRMCLKLKKLGFK